MLICILVSCNEGKILNQLFCISSKPPVLPLALGREVISSVTSISDTLRGIQNAFVYGCVEKKVAL